MTTDSTQVGGGSSRNNKAAEVYLSSDGLALHQLINYAVDCFPVVADVLQGHLIRLVCNLPDLNKQQRTIISKKGGGGGEGEGGI